MADPGGTITPRASTDPQTLAFALGFFRSCLYDGALLTISGYIHYYNHERTKTKLKGLSPVQYRTQPSVA